MKENPSKYGLIGKDIQYSLSPLIYNYWFNLYGINASYDLIDVSEISINLINNLKNQHYLGFNITQPYKQDILGYVSHLSKEVNEIKSCNLIIYKDSILEAYNSDYIGLLDSFKYFNLDLKNKNILILGAGGTTNALIYSLILLNIDNITILNRDLLKIKDLSNIFKQIKINDFKKDEKFDIIFNSTSISFIEAINFFNLKNIIDANTIFYDMSYTNKKLIKNKNYINGLFMLLFQARYNFNAWFNINPLVDNKLIEKIKDN
jgi:shikimate dehydrogenase